MNATTTFSQMIDLAISFPEIGAVNFNLLRSFFHALIKQLQLNDTYMEYDIPAEKPLTEIYKCNDPTKSTQTGKDGKESIKKRASVICDEIEKDVKITKGEEYDEKSDLKQKKSRQKHKTQESDDDEGSPNGDVKRQESDDSFNKLEQKVSELAAKLEVVETLSSHEELLSRSREPSTTPFSDVWHIMNLTKRMDASEEGLKKFASALEELAKETAGNDKKITEIVNKLNTHDIHIDSSSGQTKPVKTNVEDAGIRDSTYAEDMQNNIQSMKISGHQNTDKDNKARSEIEDNHISDIKDVNQLVENNESMQQQINTIKEEILDLTSQQKDILSFTEMFPLESFPDVLADISDMKSKVDEINAVIQENAVPTDSHRVSQIETQLEDHSEKINELSNNFNNQMDIFQGQMEDLESELGVLLERFNTGESLGGETTDMRSLGELYNKLQGLQTEMENLSETANKLMADQEERKNNINVLLEQIEVIKIIKADKEALEDALAEKADALSVNRKVSHDQFDAAYNELQESIIEAQARLGFQEKGWVTAIAEIQKDIGSKLDRIEITPLQEIIDKKMKSIQENIRAISVKRKETEASGTKKRFLRNVNCISCDKDVVMRNELDGPLLPMQEALPPTRSMRPFLTYELDHIRKEQKRLPSRNMHHFENAIVEPKLKTDVLDGTTHIGGHLCSRYCGGSHTMITNQQRVCRVGHFSDHGVLSGKLQGTSDGNVR